MRVAVHFPAGHPLAVGETVHGDVEPNDGPSVAAYKLGRIEDGVHNAPVGHEPIALDRFLADLVAEAQAEYPDAEVVIERLVDNGDGTGEWIPAEDFDAEEHTPMGAGKLVSRDVVSKARPG